MLIDNLEKLPDSFKSGIRGLLLVLRNKDGNIGNAQRKAIVQISQDIDQWHATVEYFQKLRECSQYENHRIYASVNRRNIQKAIHEFKRRQLEFDYGNNIELDNFYIDVRNRFFSCLMNPNSRSESNFLIDCDTDDEYHNAIQKIPPFLILLDYKTKNGRHVITKPYNPHEINVLPKKDDLLYIG